MPVPARRGPRSPPKFNLETSGAGMTTVRRGFPLGEGVRRVERARAGARAKGISGKGIMSPLSQMSQLL
jgi:hypothetical protein